MASSSFLPDAVQKIAQNVQKVTKAATTSSSKVIAAFSSTNQNQDKPASPKKQNRIEELADLLDQQNPDSTSGFSSFISAGSTDPSISKNQTVVAVKSATVAPVQKAYAASKQISTAVSRKMMQLKKENLALEAEKLSVMLKQAKSSMSVKHVCTEIASHLSSNAQAVEFYTQFGIEPILLKESKRSAAARRCLTLMGYAGPVKGAGVSILTLDGGGMKGLALIEVLKQLEKSIGEPLHKGKHFDYVMGVSTGGIVALMVFLLRIPLEECEKLYLDLGTQMFSRAAVVGTSQLLLKSAFYDSKLWEAILKDKMGEMTFADFAGDPDTPKVSLLSAVVGEHHYRPYLFRNYNTKPNPFACSSTFPLLSGTSKYKLWQGCRASSAAPFYYEEFKLDGVVYMDGGLLANNPTAFALHEASNIWPHEETNCIVSVGTGRVAEAWLPMAPGSIQSSATVAKPSPADIEKKSLNELAKSPTLRTKILGIVQAATDTEGN